MDNINHVLKALLRALRDMLRIVLTLLGSAEIWMRGQLTALGVPQELQSILLIAVAVLLVVVALRLLSGVIRLAIVVLLIVVALDLLVPGLQL